MTTATILPGLDILERLDNEVLFTFKGLDGACRVSEDGTAATDAELLEPGVKLDPLMEMAIRTVATEWLKASQQKA